MTAPDRTQYERQKLSDLLRRLRADAGLSGADAARRAGFSQSKLSKIENGLLLPSLADAEALCRGCHAASADHDKVLELVGALHTEVESARAILRRGAYRKQEQIGRVEAETIAMRAFAPSIVIGLLQTPAYMRRVFGDGLSAEDAERAVEARISRQAVLHDRNRRFTFVVPEGAVKWRAGSPELMIEQLRRIAEVSELPNVRVGLIPWRTEAAVFPIHGFTVYDDRMVIVGTWTATASMTDPRDIAEYVELFTALEEIAVFGDEARAELERIAADYERLD